jgi:hypothetical protein
MEISIGRDSSNQVFYKSINSLPHLFISYSYNEQLVNFFKHNILELSQQPRTQFFFLLSEENTKQLLINTDISFPNHNCVTNGESPGNIPSRKKFFSSIARIMNHRLRLFKKKGCTSINDYNDKNKSKPLQNIIVFIDDTFGLLLPSKSNAGLSFVKLLLAGQATGIHCITASAFSYKNLITQLVNLNVKINQHVSGFITENNLNTLPPLAAELVINPEDFIYFKEKGSYDYIRLYNL